MQEKNVRILRGAGGDGELSGAPMVGRNLCHLPRAEVWDPKILENSPPQISEKLSAQQCAKNRAPSVPPLERSMVAVDASSASSCTIQRSSFGRLSRRDRALESWPEPARAAIVLERQSADASRGCSTPTAGATWLQRPTQNSSCAKITFVVHMPPTLVFAAYASEMLSSSQRSLAASISGSLCFEPPLTRGAI